VLLPLLTVNGWIMMQRKVTGGSVSFNTNWAEYRNGFGSAWDDDNYWLGLDKIYRLLQFGNLRLRVEVLTTCIYQIIIAWQSKNIFRSSIALF